MFKNLFLGNTNIDFYNKRNLLQKIFIVEIVIFLTVLICAAIGILNLNFSIDFTGGTTYQLTSEYSKSDIDEVLTNNILEVSRYQTYENSDTVLFSNFSFRQFTRVHIDTCRYCWNYCFNWLSCGLLYCYF